MGSQTENREQQKDKNKLKLLEESDSNRQQTDINKNIIEYIYM